MVIQDNFIPHYEFLGKFSFDSTLDLHRVSNLLNSTNKGDTHVITTPYYYDGILEDFDKIFKTYSHEFNPNLLKLESSNRTKFGPRSIAKSGSQRKLDVDKYFERSTDYSITDISISPVLLGNLRLRPLSVQNAIESCKNSTNAGLPFFVRKGLVKDRLVSQFSEILSLSSPCILFTRTQEGGKTRTVWGYPFSDTAMEMRYFKPYFAVEKGLSYRSAVVNPNAIDISLTNLINSIRQDETFISIDFSSYDTSVRYPLVGLCVDIICSYYQPTYHESIKSLFKRMFNIGLITPWRYYVGEHGMPSGSTFTNTIDSLCQVVLAMSSGFVSLENFQVQGDDGVYKVKADDVNKFIDFFSCYGFTINEEKSVVSANHLLYLQNLYDPFYRCDDGIVRGIYSTYRALCRLCYMERFVDFQQIGISGEDYFVLRSISILENCKNHPIHRPLVKFIASLDKRKLEFDPSSLSKFAKHLDKEKGGSSLLHRYGDDIRGILSFETLKILKDL